jgi:transcriptional regulator with XRE-family HTH domain
MQAVAIEATIGRRLRRRRVALSLSLKDLAERTNMSPARLAGYETGRRHIAAATLVRLAAALAIDLDYFFEDLPRGAPPARAFGVGLI